MKQLVLFNGGKSEEHAITLTSCEYLKQTLKKLPAYQVHEVMISRSGQWSHQGQPCHLTPEGVLQTSQANLPIAAAIAYLHGHPAETGHLLALLELYNIPALGPSHEAATLSFNKVSTKYWLQPLGIPTTPAMVVNSLQQLSVAEDFLRQYDSVFVKASSQGSSRGCHQVNEAHHLGPAITDALALSPYALIEKSIQGRELEVATYEYQGELQTSLPGEIIPPAGTFYSYHEKYHPSSRAQTAVVAQDLPPEITQTIRSHCRQIFEWLKLCDLARIDFFYTPDEGIIFNEINIFPGLTPISMFPQMLEHNGPTFKDFLDDRLKNLLSP